MYERCLGCMKSCKKLSHNESPDVFVGFLERSEQMKKPSLGRLIFAVYIYYCTIKLSTE